MPNLPAKIDLKDLINGDKTICIKLPVTNPTGKIRVKRRLQDYELGEPIATRQAVIDEYCYLEWQIGYDSRDPADESSIEEITFTRKGEIKYGSELTKIYYLGLLNGIFQENSIESLLQFAHNINDEQYFEKQLSVSRIEKGDFSFLGLNFKKIEEKYPLLILKGSGYDIEVIVRHKQRAVGFQSMIYVCLPINVMNERIMGRTAEAKEYVSLNVSENINNFVYDAFKVFSLASKQHNEDIINILNSIKMSL